MTKTLGQFSESVCDLAPVPQAMRDDLAARDKSAADHRAALLALPAMRQVRTAGVASAGPLAFPLVVAAWNLERCLLPAESAALLAEAGAGLVLLSEIDDGMARTGQRDNAADMAERLGMAFAYGVEFLELSLGNAADRAGAVDGHNARGFHGNAILARAAIADAALIRLDDDGRWFGAERAQPRIGGRVAVTGWVAVEDGRLLAVSTHLESSSNAAFREQQMVRLLDAVDAMAGSDPVIIGGDMNTGNQVPGGDWRLEGLFRRAEERGYAVHGGHPTAPTTRASRLTPNPQSLKLDWFFTRGLVVEESRIVAALAADGTPLSDHELMLCRIAGSEPSGA